MGWKHKLNFRIASLFKCSRLEDEMDQEMRSHFDQLVEDFQAQGHTLQASRRLARHEFGNFERAKEECRDNWGTRFLFDLLRDFRFAARMLRKKFGHSLICVLTIAIGIAACSTVFSVVDAILFRPLPYKEPNRMVAIWEAADFGKNTVAGGSFLDWRQNAQSASAMMIHNRVEQNLKSEGSAERLQGWEASSDFEEVLGVSMLLGRGFSKDDEQVGAAPVVILPEETWRTRFDADPNLIGKTLTLNEIAREVIGIMPENSWLEPGVEFFIPAILNPNQGFRSGRGSHWALVWARLSDNATPQQLQTELRSIKESLNSEYPEFKREWSILVEPFREQVSNGSSSILWTLSAAVGCVMLIVCANVSNLVLSRTLNRGSELAMRATLGASRRRLIRQSLTESLLLSLAGGLIGLLLSLAAIASVQVAAQEILPGALIPKLDSRAVAATLLLSCASALLFGILPSLVASRRDPKSQLGTGGKSSLQKGRSRIQSTLVIAEIALTIALLSGFGLLYKSLNKQLSENPGYNIENTYTFDLNLPSETYRGRAKRLAYIENLQAVLKQTPSIKSSSTLSASPLSRGIRGEFVSKTGEEPSNSRKLASVIYVEDNFFETLEAPLIAGRPFDSFDNSEQSRRVTVIDENLARTLFGEESAVGQFIDTSGSSWEIVGIVQNQKLDPSPREGGYLYLPQKYFPFTLSVIARVHENTPNALQDIQSAIRSIDSGIPMANTRSLRTAIENTAKEERFVLALISIFAAIATLLAGVGMYSVMSFAVATRRRELSIRTALGASQTACQLLVVKSGARLIAVGLASGLVIALFLARLIASELYQVSPSDPLTLTLSAGTITLIGLVASWIPASRIAKQDPVRGLRSE